MKYVLRLSLFVFLITLISACASKSKISQLEAEYSALEQKYQEKDSSLTRLISYLDTLSNSIESITRQENFINLGINEDGTKMSRRDRKANIELLASLLESQRETIQRLEERISQRDSSITQFKVLISGLYAQLEEKNRKIQNLRLELDRNATQLVRYSKEVDKLKEDNAAISESLNESTQVISVQDKMINTAYFLVGTRKELRNAGIIAKINNKLNPDKINTDKFVEVDIRNFTELNLSDAKSVKLITQHPGSSYKLTKTGDKSYTLSILSPNEFWSLSSYLIVMTN